ncbi:MAG: hypothetical protein U1G07_23835 [Verrucomicrobiota bacterium]
MKLNLIFCALAASIVLAHAQARAPKTAPQAPPPPPPVYTAANSHANTNSPYVYEQQPVGGRPYLIAPEQAQAIINRFKDEYKKLGSPRFLIYVNRDLIDENSGMKLSSHKRVVESSRTGANKDGNNDAASTAAAPQTERAASTNIYKIRDRKEAPLADKQTVRDVERLFGRPLRMAGVALVDQRIATQLLGSKPVDSFTIQPDSEQARKERDALAKTADVVLEILIASKDVTVPEVSGDRTYTTPDIQATAIRLSDSKILAQATAADLIGQGISAGRAARNFGIREIAEATALSLMEDLMLQ